jgi:hypothetical protein
MSLLATLNEVLEKFREIKIEVDRYNPERTFGFHVKTRSKVLSEFADNFKLYKEDMQILPSSGEVFLTSVSRFQQKILDIGECIDRIDKAPAETRVKLFEGTLLVLMDDISNELDSIRKIIEENDTLILVKKQYLLDIFDRLEKILHISNSVQGVADLKHL